MHSYRHKTAINCLLKMVNNCLPKILIHDLIVKDKFHILSIDRRKNAALTSNIEKT